MKNVDLDQLKTQWQSAHLAIEPGLKLDVEALRAGLMQRSRRAFTHHGRWLLLGLVGQVALVTLLVMFLAGHWQDSIYRLLALPLALLSAAQAAVTIERWRALGRLDPAGSVMAVRAEVDRLRSRQLRVTRWVALSSVLLWLPLILVAVKGLFGFDLLDVLPPSVVWVNLGAGVVFLVAGDLALRWIARRWSGSGRLHRLLVEVVGRSWQGAERAFDARESLEHSLEAGEAFDGIGREEMLPEPARASMRRLRSRLLLVACVYCALVLLVGGFNALHGGQAWFLVPGIVLHGFLIAQMAMALHVRDQLATLNFGCGAAIVSERIAALAASQLRVARVGLWLVPVLGVLLVQVLGKIVADANVLATLPDAALWLVGAVAIAACWSLTRPRLQPLLARIATALLLGSTQLSARLRGELKD